MDIGDVLFVPHGRYPIPGIIELKDGSVNSEFLKSISLEGASLETYLRELPTKHGKAGVKQRERIVRQKQMHKPVQDLIYDGQGIDPV